MIKEIGTTRPGLTLKDEPVSYPKLAFIKSGGGTDPVMPQQPERTLARC